MNLKLAAALALAVSSTPAQTAPPSRPEFEVASIKPSKLGTPTSFGVGNGGASERNVTLKILLALAYRLQAVPDIRGARLCWLRPI